MAIISSSDKSNKSVFKFTCIGKWYIRRAQCNIRETQMKVTVYKPADWIVYALVFSISIGQVEQWTNFYSNNSIVWLLHFLSTLIILSIFILAAEQEFIKLREKERIGLFYLMIATIVWFFQKMYTVNKSALASTFEDGCQRELLLISSICSFFLLTLSIVSVFSALIFLT